MRNCLPISNIFLLCETWANRSEWAEKAKEVSRKSSLTPDLHCQSQWQSNQSATKKLCLQWSRRKAVSTKSGTIFFFCCQVHYQAVYLPWEPSVCLAFKDNISYPAGICNCGVPFRGKWPSAQHCMLLWLLKNRSIKSSCISFRFIFSMPVQALFLKKLQLFHQLLMSHFFCESCSNCGGACMWFSCTPCHGAEEQGEDGSRAVPGAKKKTLIHAASTDRR